MSQNEKKRRRRKKKTIWVKVKENKNPKKKRKWSNHFMLPDIVAKEDFDGYTNLSTPFPIIGRKGQELWE